MPVMVGPYRIEERLGGGGMGEVYRAHDDRLNRWVAIKQLLPDRAVDDVLRKRFRREARAAAGLNHPTIVQIFDILVDIRGHDWIVMELVDGPTLKEVLVQGPLAPELAIRLGYEIAVGLARAHERGIVHRDLKLENVMLTDAGHVKILDFGLAKDEESPGSDTTSPSAVLGTSRSMAPEQITGSPVGPRTDLFSFGVLLFEALTGESPFKASNTILTLARVCTHEPPAVLDLNPNVPRELSHLVGQLLQKEPERRPSSAGEVADALAMIMQGDPISPVTPGRGLWVGTDTPATVLDALLESSEGFCIKTLLRLELARLGRLVESLGEARTYELMSVHGRICRDLLAQFGGHEAEKTDAGYVLLFDRPIDAVDYAMAYHSRLIALSADVAGELERRSRGRVLQARLAIHLGEVYVHENPTEDVALGAKRFEVEGHSKEVTRRLLLLARPGQTLLTREAFELARQAFNERPHAAGDLRWVQHGDYRIDGERRLALFEVGRAGQAPLRRPRRPAVFWGVLAAAALAALLLLAVFLRFWEPGPRPAMAPVDSEAQTDDGRELAEALRAESEGRAQGSSILVANALLRKGWALHRLQRRAEAEAAFSEGRSLYASMGNLFKEGEASDALGNLSWHAGDLARAEAFYEQAIATYRRADHRLGITWTLIHLALVQKCRGQLAAAAASYEEAIRLAATIELEEARITSLEGLALVQAEQGELVRAATSVEDLAAYETVDPQRRGWRYIAEGVLELRQGHAESAQKTLRKALAIARGASGQGNLMGHAVHYLAEAALAAGDHAAAETWLDEALRTRRELREAVNLAVSELLRMRLWIARGEIERARRGLERLVPELERQGQDAVLAEARRLLDELSS